MAIMPGAVWRPITIPGGNPGPRTKGRGVVLHVAASEATSLFGFFNNNPNANSHFYVAKDGTVEQYVDTDLQAWASMAANKTTISVETQGGVTNPDGEPWTPAQVAALGRICAWAHATEGVPLTAMPNSLPTSKGIGYHRLGIKPWVVAGGELWSSSTGKVCPGAAKIAQLPAVIAAAQAPAPTPVETDMQLTDLIESRIPSDVDPKTGKGRMVPLSSLLENVQYNAWAAQQTAQQAVDAVGKVQTPTVDAAAFLAALKADPDAMALLGSAFAKAVNDDAAKRLQS